MKTLYLECSMGAAGDMLTAALLELIPQREELIAKLQKSMPQGVLVSANKIEKMGISGTQMTVLIDGEEEESIDAHHHSHESHHHGNEHHHHHHHHGEHSHHHTSMHDIETALSAASISPFVREHALAVYQIIARAESTVHNKPVSEIHFHEVGTKDALADIIAFCMLLEELAPERIVVSPVHVGYGQVHCAHGILPVPAPATAYILQGIPIYSGAVEGELCTPTGAALLKHFADEFSVMPVMETRSVGYGFGKKDFSRLNCVRAFIGETENQSEQLLELCCNLDDMTGEAIGFAQEKLLECGALDVFTVPVIMKKSRPGVLLTALCYPAQREIIRQTMFQYTSTLGIRERICERYALRREIHQAETSYGSVHFKCAEGFGVSRCKAEFEDIRHIAETAQVTADRARFMAESEISNQ